MRREIKFLSATAAVAVALGTWVTSVGAAPSEPPPKPKVDCSKSVNQKLKACQNKHRELSDDDLFYAGYWLARKGQYTLALDYLNQAKNRDDARILTYIGFATRKLGDVDAAMPYYTRALSVDPNLLATRAYLGEAFLQKGDRTAALEQLGEIAKRCGTTCDEYTELAAALAKS